MRHRVLSRRLKRTSGEFRALLRNQAKQLFDRGSVTTTLHKAKLLRPFAERLITIAREPAFNNVKRVKQELVDGRIVGKLFSDIGPVFKARPGGYTRILKLGPRGGDTAEMARIELVEKPVGLKRSAKSGGRSKKEVKEEIRRDSKKNEKKSRKVVRGNTDAKD